MDISPNIYNVDLTDQKYWLGTELGTGNTEQVTLNIPEFQAIGAVETTYEPNGRIVYRIRSGIALVKDNAANLYGPAQTLGAKLATPVQAAPATANTGGTIAAGTVLNCVVTAVSAAGETVVSNSQTLTVPAGTNTNTATFSVGAVPSATAYKFYFGPVGAPTGYIQQAGTSLALTANPATTAGTPPAIDTSAAWQQSATCAGHLYESVVMYKLPSGLYKAGGALLWVGKVRLSKLPTILGGQPWSVSGTSSPVFDPTGGKGAPLIRYIAN